jgi:hypothetical protein
VIPFINTSIIASIKRKRPSRIILLYLTMRVMKLITMKKQYAKIWVAGIALISLGVPAIATAVTPISQGFLTKDKAPLGAIVSLQKNSTDYVNAATTDSVNNIIGVVIGGGNSLLSLSSDQANQIQVATDGVVQVLVSNINGSIYSGDQITASPVGGVGMKATGNIKVVGIAQDNLSDGSKVSYTDKKGHKHPITLGEVPILVNVAYYYKQPDKTIIPSAVQNIANALAGKSVNSLPILISLGIFLVTLVIVVSIIYAMIHSSIISVGRNPMSQSAIYRNLIQLSGLVVAILGLAVISIYMVLTKF